MPDGKDVVFATDINDATVVVGSSVSSSGHSRGFRWTAADGMQGLADLSSVTRQSSAASINNAGYIVGLSENDGGVERPVLWKPSGEVIELLGIPNANGDSVANAINNLNQVVGNVDVGNLHNGIFRAFVWTADSSMRDLNTLLDSSGQGWTLTNGYGINDSGQIVGQGVYCAAANSCVQHAFLLTPVPEPGILLMMAAVVVGFCGRRCRVC